MRTLLAIAILVVGSALPSQAAEWDRRDRYNAERSYSYGYGYGYGYRRYSRQQVECERARHADPSGVYAGFPCWARDAFGSGKNGGTRR
jgi:hypothetical protein